MELRGFEPLTFCMPCSTIPSEGVALGPVTADQDRFRIWGRLARSGVAWGRCHLVWHLLPVLAAKGGTAMATQINDYSMSLAIDDRIVATAQSSERPVLVLVLEDVMGGKVMCAGQPRRASRPRRRSRGHRHGE